ncbi:Cdc48 2-like protein [Glarea lozoyensis ATCC 20868]|uniref:Cdc48 2-like protein n=1 Tax=Glarea lozoyensis (strain ATCC 20868 / MF5171) TaxID=1116229 RepID=S3DA62_GLAL2|nr:Cdc48 2-like protein [Glarea lozoyensis ATCC 20868]EPE28851.1 Cdc48 2-like protein [Glarea lozoyensis ATCC 20868]
MSSNPDISLTWSAVLKVASSSSRSLPGDKIRLPQSALEQLLAASTLTVPSTRPSNINFDPFNPYSLAAARAEHSQWRDTQQQLPHPLTFRLVNAANGNIVYAGIREFSAEEGEVELSPFLCTALGIAAPETTPKIVSSHSSEAGTPSQPVDLTDDEAIRITVHAKQLPRGTYVRLRPLEAGYNPEDWKSLLERHMRESYTTLTNGEILTVRGSKSEEFRFLIDKFEPNGDGICVVDTDLEVDIEALNEEQARETLKQIMTKAQTAPGSAEGSSIGGDIDIWDAATGRIIDGDDVDFRLPSWNRSLPITVEVTVDDGESVDMFLSPYSTRQRAKPREDEHIFGDFSGDAIKSVTLQPSNVILEDAEALLFSLHARPTAVGQTPAVHQYSLRVSQTANADTVSSSENPIIIDQDEEMRNPDEQQCKNCRQWIPRRTMMLHENFCLRNNVLCPHCSNVFQKRSPEWQDHWHCEHDSSHGNTPSSKSRHDEVHHTPRACPNCEYEAPNLKDLASHRTSTCPGKLILCQFCHLEVPQEGDPFNPSSESLISGLSAHELADGARTTECHLCSKIVRLRDMATHLKHHEMEKTSKLKPEVCRNVNCARTLHGVGKNGEIGAGSRMGQGPGNDIGLCSICFGPLYVSMYDPEGKALKRRVERRYLAQMIKGCGKSWCENSYCKTARSKTEEGKESLTTQQALPIVKPLMDNYNDHSSSMYFCVDDGTQKRRKFAELMAAEKVYELEWCIAALEAQTGNLDAARQWLQNWAPAIQH